MESELIHSLHYSHYMRTVKGSSLNSPPAFAVFIVSQTSPLRRVAYSSPSLSLSSSSFAFSIVHVACEHWRASPLFMARPGLIQT